MMKSLFDQSVPCISFFVLEVFRSIRSSLVILQVDYLRTKWTHEFQNLLERLVEGMDKLNCNTDSRESLAKSCICFSDMETRRVLNYLVIHSLTIMPAILRFF
ncbi:hypothetical protein O6H91_Y057700 [Diphasiastrum complanatum]|nr:hypothetical protein O6H91_Y057700 [Diphasiastrum complanatum]